MTRELTKRRVRRSAVGLIAGALLVACGAHGPRFELANPEAGHGLIYVYRRGGALGGANSWHLWANGTHLGVVSNGGYFAYPAAPGNVTFKAQLKFNPLTLIGPLLPQEELITIPVEEGEVYFVRFKIGPSMELVSKDVGEKEMRNMREFPAP